MSISIESIPTTEAFTHSALLSSRIPASSLNSLQLYSSKRTRSAFKVTAHNGQRIHRKQLVRNSPLKENARNFARISPNRGNASSRRAASSTFTPTITKVPEDTQVHEASDDGLPVEQFISIQKHALELDSFDPFNLSSAVLVSTTTEHTKTPVPPTSSDDVQQAKTQNVPTAATITSKSFGFNPFAAFSEVWKARFLLFAAAALYGTNFTLVKILHEHLPVGASTSIRFTLASLATLPFLLPSVSKDAGKSIDNWGQAWKDTFPVVLAGMEVGLYNGIGYVAQAVGLQTTDASKSAFICSLAVVIVPILDFLLLKKSLTMQSIAGLLCAVVGVAMLELSGSDFALTAGDLFTFAQPLFFGIGFWRMESAMRKYPTEASRLTAAQLLMVAIGSVVNCWLVLPHIGAGIQPPSLEQVWAWVTDPMILAALGWTGIVTTALTIYMETLALKSLSAAEATLIFSTEPIWGAGFASVVAGERLGPSAIAGAALILSGCAVSTSQGKSEAGEAEDKPRGNTISEVISVPSAFGGGLATVAMQAKVVTDLQAAFEEAVQENVVLIRVESSCVEAAVGVASDALNSEILEESVCQLQSVAEHVVDVL